MKTLGALALAATNRENSVRFLPKPIKNPLSFDDGKQHPVIGNQRTITREQQPMPSDQI
jgi:hypothetical protein